MINGLLNPNGCMDLNHMIDFALHELQLNITTTAADSLTPKSELFIGKLGPIALNFTGHSFAIHLYTN